MAEIRLTSQPLSAATAALEKTARLYDSVARSHERIAKLADKEEHRRTQVAARAAEGPISRLRRLQGRTATPGEEAQDRAYRLAQAQRAVERMKPPDLTSRILSLIRSTRFGKGLMPLIGRAADVIVPGGLEKAVRGIAGRFGGGAAAGEAGAGAAAGAGAEAVGAAGAAGAGAEAAAGAGALGLLLNPVTLIIGALVLAAIGLKKLSDATNAALGPIRDMRSAMMETGGTAAETGRLAAMGLNPSQQAAAASGLRGRMGSDPFAIMTGGFRMDPRFGGSQNIARDLQQQLEILHQMGPGEGQLLRARRLGLEGMLDLVNVSESVWQEEKRLGDARRQLLGSGQQAADLAARYRLLGEHMDILKAKAMQWFLPIATGVLKFLELLAHGIDLLIPAPIKKWLEANMDEQVKDGKKKDALKNSQDKLTDALDDLRSTMENQRTTTGGGQLGGGLPASMRGDEMYRALVGNRFKLGAFR